VDPPPFNPWWGCVKISPACANCYAATFDKRVGGDHWGADRNAAAAKANERHRVFCASMADVMGDIETFPPELQVRQFPKGVLTHAKTV
jgi:hypothetical protein